MSYTVSEHRHGASLVIRLRDLAAWLIVMFAFTIPFEELVRIPGLGSITRALGIIALPVGLLALVNREHVRLRAPPMFVVLMALFVVWNISTYFWSFEPLATLGRGVTYAQLLVFVWLATEFCRERVWRIALMQAFVLGNYLAFMFVTFRMFDAGVVAYRDTGPLGANGFAIALAYGIPMAVLLMNERSSRVWTFVNAAYPFVALFGVVLAASRGGFIVALVGLLAVPFALVGMSLVRRFALFAAVVGAAAFSFVAAPTAFPDLYRNVQRLEATGDELMTGTLTGRTGIWRETLGVFSQSPAIGVGAGAARHALAETDIGRVQAVHNVYLVIAADAGLIGLLLFSVTLGLAFIAIPLGERRHTPYIGVLALALLVSMMSLNAEANKGTWLIVALVALHRPLVMANTDR